MNVRITHETDRDGGTFVMTDGDTQIGEMTYRRTGTSIIIDHTEVDPAMRGRGLARQLVTAAVEWPQARTIVGSCWSGCWITATRLPQAAQA